MSDSVDFAPSASSSFIWLTQSYGLLLAIHQEFIFFTWFSHIIWTNLKYKLDFYCCGNYVAFVFIYAQPYGGTVNLRQIWYRPVAIMVGSSAFSFKQFKFHFANGFQSQWSATVMNSWVILNSLSKLWIVDKKLPINKFRFHWFLFPTWG